MNNKIVEELMNLGIYKYRSLQKDEYDKNRKKQILFLHIIKKCLKIKISRHLILLQKLY